MKDTERVSEGQRKGGREGTKEGEQPEGRRGREGTRTAAPASPPPPDTNTTKNTDRKAHCLTCCHHYLQLPPSYTGNILIINMLRGDGDGKINASYPTDRIAFIPVIIIPKLLGSGGE